ncbi:FCD domain-containing protein [Klebsiella pneumoniae]
MEFHRAIADASKNDYFVAFHDFLRSQLRPQRRRTRRLGNRCLARPCS